MQSKRCVLRGLLRTRVSFAIRIILRQKERVTHYEIRLCNDNTLRALYKVS